MTRARLLLTVTLAVATVRASAAEVTPETIARVQRDQAKAEAKVDADHGNRKPSEMSPEERNQVVHETAAADQKVLDDHGVDRKEFARKTAKLTLEERAQVDQASRELEERERAEKEAAEKKEADEKARAALEAQPDIVNPREVDEAGEDIAPGGEGQDAAASEPAAEGAAEPAAGAKAAKPGKPGKAKSAGAKPAAKKKGH